MYGRPPEIEPEAKPSKYRLERFIVEPKAYSIINAIQHGKKRIAVFRLSECAGIVFKKEQFSIRFGDLVVIDMNQKAAWGELAIVSNKTYEGQLELVRWNPSRKNLTQLGKVDGFYRNL